MINPKWHVHSFTDLDNPGFDVGAYSRLKHGSDVSARQLGHEMAEDFWSDKFKKPWLLAAPTLVIPAPGTAVPVAATLLARHFAEWLSFRMADANVPPVEVGHVHRYMSYSMNTYADISAEERKKLLSGDKLFFPASFMEGKQLIFIDDVCITGTHEEKLDRELDEAGFENERMYACYAKYQGEDPSIEGRLNKVSVRGPLDVVWLAQEPGFTVTVRCLRLMLEANTDDLGQVLRGLPRRMREQFCSAAIEKGYHRYPEYRFTYEMLRDSVR